jgi:hypothetical protein
VNVVTNLNLCYKAVRTDLLKSIPLVRRDFRIEPELTIKLAKRHARIFEVRPRSDCAAACATDSASSGPRSSSASRGCRSSLLRG